MKPSFLRLLVCPGCGSGLDPRVRAAQGAEILEGELRCFACGASYPIVRGVPRFVGSGAYAGSFGTQWRWFRKVQLDSQSGGSESAKTFLGTTGWDREQLSGRLALDAGVGAGRFAEVAARGGAEVVGIDITCAIDAAYANLGHLENVHLAQADIFSLPFRAGSFDLAYSIGVLHHTPDTRAAFDRVAAMVRDGGALAVYLYARYGPENRSSDVWRRITTRLPLPVMLALTSLSVPGYYLCRIPVLGKLLHLAFPISRHPHWRWRWLDTFDWYTPQYQWKLLYPEVFRWFREAGFTDMEVFEQPIRMRGTKVPGSRVLPVPPKPSKGSVRVVALGGGTGLPVVLRGLRDALFPAEWRSLPVRGRDRLAAVVTVADDGGSSGRLRQAYRILAPGDIRNCLLALAEGDSGLAALFRFRFEGQQEVGGHSLGNLILAALHEVEGDFARAVERAGEILGVRGRVLPSTTADVRLRAQLADGRELCGECEIAAARGSIEKLQLEPEAAPALPQALEAVRNADLVVLGPGSLYTSLLPNLLVRGMAEALCASNARVVLVMNLMTQPGETDGYTAADHVRALRRHVPGLPIHDVLLNTTPIDEENRSRYATDSAVPVVADVEALEALGCRVVARELLAQEPWARHDAQRLGQVLVELATTWSGRAPSADEEALPA